MHVFRGWYEAVLLPPEFMRAYHGTHEIVGLNVSASTLLLLLCARRFCLCFTLWFQGLRL